MDWMGSMEWKQIMKVRMRVTSSHSRPPPLLLLFHSGFLLLLCYSAILLFSVPS